eukprot:4329171-Amphidinium_carterae.1
MAWNKHMDSVHSSTMPTTAKPLRIWSLFRKSMLPMDELFVSVSRAKVVRAKITVSQQLMRLWLAQDGQHRVFHFGISAQRSYTRYRSSDLLSSFPPLSVCKDDCL